MSQDKQSSSEDTTAESSPESDDAQSARDVAEDLRAQFADEYQDYDLDTLTERVTLFSEHINQADEVERSVISTTAQELGIERGDLMGSGGGGSGPADHVTVSQIRDDLAAETWVSVTVTPTQLWDNDSDSIGQVGLVADETGQTKFLAWAKSDLPALEKETTYRLENVVVDEYEGRKSIKLNSSTDIVEVDEAIDVNDNTETFTLPMLVFQNGSGLIKRCTHENCSRVLRNDSCYEHGPIDEAQRDLRIRAVFDDGDEVRTVFFDRELTAELTGITLEDANEMAMQALDTEVVAKEMAELLCGKYYTVEAQKRGQYWHADSITAAEPLSADDIEQQRIRARSI
jgi:replication factor A1